MIALKIFNQLIILFYKRLQHTLFKVSNKHKPKQLQYIIIIISTYVHIHFYPRKLIYKSMLIFANVKYAHFSFGLFVLYKQKGNMNI